MEIHHSSRKAGEKKGFKEYFLEFLMIFLAVTMGFFAERLREYFGDREKETQYMHSLAEDLKKDTTAIHFSIRRLQEDIGQAHELVMMIARNQFFSQNDSTILALTVHTGHSVDIIFNDRTSSQLKSSGAMRLVRHQTISDSILQYWNNQIAITQIHDRFEELRLEQRKVGFKTFSWFKVFFWGYAGSDIVNGIPSKAVINPANVTEFLNVTSTLFNSASTQYVPMLQKQLNLATGLIGQIEREYP